MDTLSVDMGLARRRRSLVLWDEVGKSDLCHKLKSFVIDGETLAEHATVGEDAALEHKAANHVDTGLQARLSGDDATPP